MPNSYKVGTYSILSFLAGAAAGAIVIALTTPKRGSELRSSLKSSALRAKRRLLEFGDEVRDSSGPEAARDDLKEGISSAGRALRGGVRKAGQDLRA